MAKSSLNLFNSLTGWVCTFKTNPTKDGVNYSFTEIDKTPTLALSKVNTKVNELIEKNKLVFT